jgi:Protein of unknown function (DUF1003)
MTPPGRSTVVAEHSPDQDSNPVESAPHSALILAKVRRYAARRPACRSARVHDRAMTTDPITTRSSSTPPEDTHHPVVTAQMAHRAANVQLRVADAITAFAGSMPFVYLHALLFALWMVLFERSPWPTLTLVVSLEAIFLSTFVMIGQNRQAAFQQAKADHDFTEQELELKTNTQLTRQIHLLTTELHRRLVGNVAGTGQADDPTTY